MSEPQYMLWYDLETTGTDEQRDDIVEIGCILTDLTGRALSSYESVIRPTDGGYARLMENPVVREMHLKNDLLYECVSAGARRVFHIEDEILDWLTNNTDSAKQHVVGAGSGVAHFDRRFIRSRMPQLDRRLAYYSFDVGVLRRACRYAGREDLILPDGKNHRAFTDAAHHLDEWHHYKAILQGAMPPVPEDPFHELGGEG